MDDEGSDPSTRHALLHTLLRLAPLVAAGIAFPFVLDHLGVRDVSFAPPEYGWTLAAEAPAVPEGASP